MKRSFFLCNWKSETLKINVIYYVVFTDKIYLKKNKNLFICLAGKEKITGVFLQQLLIDVIQLSKSEENPSIPNHINSDASSCHTFMFQNDTVNGGKFRGAERLKKKFRDIFVCKKRKSRYAPCYFHERASLHTWRSDKENGFTGLTKRSCTIASGL